MPLHALLALVTTTRNQLAVSKALVIVLDAVNPENNIAHKWDMNIKRGFLEQVGATYKAIKKAQKAEQRGNEEETLDAWSKYLATIFGA